MIDYEAVTTPLPQTESMPRTSVFENYGRAIRSYLDSQNIKHHTDLGDAHAAVINDILATCVERCPYIGTEFAAVSPIHTMWKEDEEKPEPEFVYGTFRGRLLEISFNSFHLLNPETGIYEIQLSASTTMRASAGSEEAGFDMYRIDTPILPSTKFHLAMNDMVN